MSEDSSDLYNVVFKGEKLDGFNMENVRNNFAKVFKLETEKVDSYFSGKPLVLRKKVDHKTAYKFKSSLAKFGAAVELKRIAPDITPALDELSLVPLEEKSPESQAEFQTESLQVKSEPNEPDPAVVANTQSANNFDSQTGEPVVEEEIAFQEESDQGDSFGAGALLASGVAAIVGAFLWKFIAVEFDYELGLIAWGIGGAVGFVAAMLGSRGQTAGIICGVLVLLSIFGGKYMAYSTFQAEFSNFYTNQPEELRESYNAEKSLAELHASVSLDEQSQKQFMADYGYSYSVQANDVSDEEFDNFMNYTVPRFEALANDSMDFEAWSSSSFQDAMGGLSTIDLMKQSFGLLDVLFLFFGIGTAFRLARGEG